MKIEIEPKVAIAVIIGVVIFSLAYIGISGSEIAEIAGAFNIT